MKTLVKQIIWLGTCGLLMSELAQGELNRKNEEDLVNLSPERMLLRSNKKPKNAKSSDLRFVTASDPVAKKTVPQQNTRTPASNEVRKSPITANKQATQNLNANNSQRVPLIVSDPITSIDVPPEPVVESNKFSGIRPRAARGSLFGRTELPPEPDEEVQERKLDARSFKQEDTEAIFNPEVSIILNNNQFYPSKIRLKRGTLTKLIFTTTNKKPGALVVQEVDVQRWIARVKGDFKEENENKDFEWEITRELNANRIAQVTMTPQEKGIYRFHDLLSGAKGEIVVE